MVSNLPSLQSFPRSTVFLFFFLLLSLTRSSPGSRGPAVLDDFTHSYGYRFSDSSGYQWPTTSATQTTKL